MRALTPQMLEGLPLFGGLVGARRTDPISSHKAIDALEKTGGARHQRIQVLAWVRRWPGRNSRELSDLACADYHMVARRLPELAELNLIERREPEDGQRLTWWPK